MIYVLAAILIFGFLIAVHEGGHFMAAKACGVRVNEFAIGMGPAIFKKTKGETTYSLRIFPVGGYCAMEGEEEDSDDPRALNNQGFWQKLLIFAAGAGMNFISGLVIILILYSGAQAFYSPTIESFAQGSPLQEQGLQVGDRLLSIDGEKVYIFSDVGLLLGMNKDGTFDLVVERQGEKVALNDFPMERREYTDQNGEAYEGFGMFFGTEKATFTSRIAYSWNNAIDFVRMVRLSLEMLFTGEAGIKDMSGPVGIVSAMTEMGEQSATVQIALENIAYMGALIAVNLAVMNLLPIPALDGGKIFFLIINQLCMLLIHKQIPPKFENYIHAAGFVLLMGLMAVVMFQDVWKIIR